MTATAPASAEDEIAYDVSGLVPAAPTTTYTNTLADDGRVILALVAQACKSTKDVAAFYKSQGPAYDGFREPFLMDRDVCLQYAVPWARLLGSPVAAVAAAASTRWGKTAAPPAPVLRTWVSVGCGTARDIEYVVDKIRAARDGCAAAGARFRLVLLDYSGALLDRARARVDALGLASCTELVEVRVTRVRRRSCLSRVGRRERP